MENQASKNLEKESPPLLVNAKESSSSPGVYLMKDEAGAILYIGKAKNLRNRLISYFQPAEHPVPRIGLLVKKTDQFDVILTETETEALILECTLIKKHRPKFNVQLKDDKAYPYLRIQIEDASPRIELTRRIKKDGARYFGPFPSASSAREVMRLLTETFQLRDCSENTFRHRSRPCILFQMKKCKAPCVEKISASDYREAIHQTIEVLEGKTERLILNLRRGMEEASEREDFEGAAYYRDQIQNLVQVTETQMADEAGSGRDRDVMGLARKETLAYGVVLQVRGGRIIAARHYHLQNTDPSQSDSEILFDFLAQYYVLTENEISGLETSRPQEVLLPTAPEDPDLLERTVSVGVRVAENGGDTRILQVARANAEYALKQEAEKQAGHGLRALEEVQEKLHLLKLPHRIECYDISNIQGDDAVGSRVTFVNGAPDKNLYRRYKIKTVEGANDFAMLQEVLRRRFAHLEEALPDLVIVDGGRGQLTQAVTILRELGIEEVGVVGLAKARVERDFKAKEVKFSSERIFIPNRKNPILLKPHQQSFKLLTHIRDEAHRFAITYHRKIRNNRSLLSRRK